MRHANRIYICIIFFFDLICIYFLRHVSRHATIILTKQYGYFFQHLLPIVEREVDHRADDLNAGITDQDVDAAEFLDRVGYALIDLRLERVDVGRFKWTGDGPPPIMPPDVRVEAARRYITSFELVTGTTFVPDPREPVARIAEALGAT